MISPPLSIQSPASLHQLTAFPLFRRKQGGCLPGGHALPLRLAVIMSRRSRNPARRDNVKAAKRKSKPDAPLQVSLLRRPTCFGHRRDDLQPTSNKGEDEDNGVCVSSSESTPGCHGDGETTSSFIGAGELTSPTVNAGLPEEREKKTHKKRLKRCSGGSTKGRIANPENNGKYLTRGRRRRLGRLDSPPALLR